MLFVGIDVAKRKHDCSILDSNGVILSQFSFDNSLSGFNSFISSISSFDDSNFSDLKVGFEATGHYSYNLEKFLTSFPFQLFRFNPLATNLKRKAQSLRKTKTDKIDSLFIAFLLFEQNAPFFPEIPYFSNLKILTRHRFRLMQYSSKLKVSFNRNIDIVFPEFPSLVSSIQQTSVYFLFLSFPSANSIANSNITKLTNILSKASRGQLKKQHALNIKKNATSSIGSYSLFLEFEIQQNIRLILQLKKEIDILDKKIVEIMKIVPTPILSIPGISFTLASSIIAEIGDIHKFESPAKLLAFAGLEPSTNQSGDSISNTNARMVKRGSTYLRWAIMNAARLVATKDHTFTLFLAKKRAEGKPFFVALSHVAKKLLRVIFHLLKTKQIFIPQS